MEGPSIVLAVEELEKFFGKKAVSVSGSSRQVDFERIRNSSLREARSWGKHLILVFDQITLRVHFLMWGSYRVDTPKKDRVPRLHVRFKNGSLFLYSCSIREVSEPFEQVYDWSSDLMSKKWDPKKALIKLNALPKSTMVCDALMDQKNICGCREYF